MAARAQLHIEVSDPGLVQSLTSFLEHTIYSPGAPRESILPVAGPDGLSILIARAELDLYLAAWRRLHPEVAANLID